MPSYPVPETIEIDGEPYNTFVRPNGEGRMWTTRPTQAQAGDVGVAKPYPLEFSGGFGFSRRYTDGAGQRIGAGHYAWSENVLMQYRALFGPAPRISYLNLAADITPPLARGFWLGGYTNSQLGGGTTVTAGGVEGADEAGEETTSVNLLTNGGFEVDTTGWVTVGTNTIESSTERAAVGERSLKAVVGSSTVIAQGPATTLTAVPHTLSARIWISSTYAGGALRLQASNFGGISVPLVLANMALVDQWQQLSVTFTPDVGDLMGNPAVLCASVNAGDVVYVDDVRINLDTYVPTWSDTSNILVDDDTYAEALTEGITEYLRASLTAATRVDLALPLTRIRARVRKRSGSTIVAADGLQTFSATGAAQTFEVPDFVTTVRVDLRGATGLSGSPSGARVQTTLAVTPGEALQVNPGGATTSTAGGWNGGGASGGTGRGGGGASDIRRGTTLADRLVVAGGGGGRGGTGSVGAGGAGAGAGENGSNAVAVAAAPGTDTGGGKGGTQVAGGAGGAGGTNPEGPNGGAGTAGALGVGGSGGLGPSGNGYGGGGGGGYYGGGGGGGGPTNTAGDTYSGAGGGGGSSYSSGTDTTFTSAYNANAGQVTISWDAVEANDVTDSEVFLWVDGVIAGANKASGAAWTNDEDTVEYEWSYAEIQGLGLTAADANGAIGIVISADVGAENSARIEHVDFDFSSQTITGAASLGGGIAIEEPQFIREYGAGLYVGAGYRTFTLDPSAATPTVEEVHDHGNAGRARSADVFDNQLVVALGPGRDIEVATSSWSTDSPTEWEDGTNRMDVVKTGGGGRLFSARDNLLFNVESGQPPTSAASYFPSTGDIVSDETDPVRSLDEYLGGLVAGTVQQVRTLDPDAGNLGRGVTPRTRISYSPWSGRSLIAIGSDLYFFTQRAAWLFRPGQPPMPIGLEELHQNNTPFIEGEPGVPDFDGQVIYVPYLFGDDSVIFTIKARKQGDVGEGAVAWHSALFLEGRRCRMVRYWGGSATRTARLFFGAATDDEPESIGWIDMGGAPGPFFFRPDVGEPALSSALYGGLDDFGKPSVRQGLDRIEVPRVENADDDNYLTLSATVDGDTFTELGIDADAPVPTWRPHAGEPITGVEIGTHWLFTNPGPEYLLARGTPMIYLYDMPTHVEERTTLLDVPDPASRETAEEVRARLASLIDDEPFRMNHTDRDFWARMRAVEMVEFADPVASDNRSVFAVQVVFVEVEVADASKLSTADLYSGTKADLDKKGAACHSGTEAFCTDGRKVGEGAGMGTGVPVWYDETLAVWLDYRTGVQILV